jgi:hypothetical protein
MAHTVGSDLVPGRLESSNALVGAPIQEAAMSPETVEAVVRPDLAVIESDQADEVEATAVPVVAAERRSGLVSELPITLVIAGAGAGLVVIAMHHFRWGNLIIGGSLLVAALMRLVLPTRQAGLLVVRGRLTDVVTMAAIGGSLLVLSAVTRT